MIPDLERIAGLMLNGPQSFSTVPTMCQQVAFGKGSRKSISCTAGFVPYVQGGVVGHNEVPSIRCSIVGHSEVQVFCAVLTPPLGRPRVVSIVLPPTLRRPANPLGRFRLFPVTQSEGIGDVHAGVLPVPLGTKVIVPRIERVRQQLSAPHHREEQPESLVKQHCGDTRVLIKALHEQMLTLSLILPPDNRSGEVLRHFHHI